MNPVVARHLKGAIASTIGAAVGLTRKPPKRFIIFTNGRTGSNLLVSLLRDHTDFRVHSEVFGEYQIDLPGIRALIDRKGPVDYLRSCFRRMTVEDFVGIKMLYYNIEEEYGLKRGVAGLSALRGEILNDPDLYFIHLKRENHVDRLLSNALARASGQFLNGAYLEEQIEVDLEWAKSELHRMQEWEYEFDRALPAERTFDVTYEALVSDKATVMSKLFAFMGAKPMAVNSSMKKQSKRPHSERISNYGELKAQFSGTEFASMFD